MFLPILYFLFFIFLLKNYFSSNIPQKVLFLDLEMPYIIFQTRTVQCMNSTFYIALHISRDQNFYDYRPKFFHPCSGTNSQKSLTTLAANLLCLHIPRIVMWFIQETITTFLPWEGVDNYSVLFWPFNVTLNQSISNKNIHCFVSSEVKSKNYEFLFPHLRCFSNQ